MAIGDLAGAWDGCWVGGLFDSRHGFSGLSVLLCVDSQRRDIYE